jgi:hypothetical protein
MATREPDEQLVHVADDPRFQEHLKRANPLEILLRGHLWAESELIGIIEDTLPHPERVELSRISFPLKVALVAANGYLEPDDVAAFLKLNSLRNKLAHNLHIELGEELVNELLASLSQRLRYMYGNEGEEFFTAFGDVLWIARLRATIACLCIRLSSQREAIAEVRLKDRENHARFLALVDRVKATPGVNPQADRQG